MGRGRDRWQKVRQENVESGLVVGDLRFQIRYLDLIHHALLPLPAEYLPIAGAGGVVILIINRKEYAVFLHMSINLMT